MTTPVVFAKVCLDTYPEAPQPVSWDSDMMIEDVRVCLRIVDGLMIVAFRGSETQTDWMRDAEGWPDWDDHLGFVHHGFLVGAHAVYGRLSGMVPPGTRIAITGHSLGGARARVMAALFAVNGYRVEEVHVFGSPKPGFANLSRIIQKSGMKHVSWRNRNDPVPLVPAILSMWEHPEEWGVFDEAADEGDFGVLRDHHIGLYLRGAQKLEPQGST